MHVYNEALCKRCLTFQFALGINVPTKGSLPETKYKEAMSFLRALSSFSAGIANDITKSGRACIAEKRRLRL